MPFAGRGDGVQREPTLLRYYCRFLAVHDHSFDSPAIILIHNSRRNDDTRLAATHTGCTSQKTRKEISGRHAAVRVGFFDRASVFALTVNER